MAEVIYYHGQLLTGQDKWSRESLGVFFDLRQADAMPRHFSEHDLGQELTRDIKRWHERILAILQANAKVEQLNPQQDVHVTPNEFTYALASGNTKNIRKVFDRTAFYVEQMLKEIRIMQPHDDLLLPPQQVTCTHQFPQYGVAGSNPSGIPTDFGSMVVLPNFSSCVSFANILTGKFSMINPQDVVFYDAALKVVAPDKVDIISPGIMSSSSYVIPVHRK